MGDGAGGAVHTGRGMIQMTGKSNPHPRDRALLVLSLVLLTGAGLDRLTMRPSRLATAYHARVRAVFDAMPLDLDPWHGTIVPEPADAIDMLKPNVLLSRVYQDPSTGRSATFLLVQCSDVRDLNSHYPPICYPNQGLKQLEDRRRQFQWKVAGTEFYGTEYSFESATLQDSRLTVVYNFMVLPDGRILPDMDEVKKLLSLDRRYFGMAQIQIVFDGKVPSGLREDTAKALIQAHMKLIDVIRKGAN
jgi:hypothetical protein